MVGMTGSIVTTMCEDAAGTVLCGIRPVKYGVEAAWWRGPSWATARAWMAFASRCACHLTATQLIACRAYCQ